MGLGRVELPTSPLSGVRSSQLSYRPVGKPGMNWWSWSGSNRRPPECKSGALPAELQPLLGDLGRGIGELARPRAKSQNPNSNPELCIEADWTLPAGARPYRQSKSQNSKWRSETDLDWKGYYLLTASRLQLLAARLFADSVTPATFSLRKEVIQPQVLLRLPCYDFTPIMSHTLGRCLPCGLACRLLVQPTFVM